MTASIIPLSTATVDLVRLATAAKQTLDINISADDTIKGHITALRDVFGNDNTTLRHLHQSFILVCDKDLLYAFIFLAQVNFNIVETWKSGIFFSVLSTSLYQWRHVVADCSADNNYDIRNLSTLLLSTFDKMNLSFLFNEYNRTRQRDGTLLLEHKK